MNNSVSTVRGNIHDARYLAILDTLTSPEKVILQERLEYWRSWEYSSHPGSPNVWVARIGGLYAGYLALENSQIHELRVQERFDVDTIAGLLVARANIQVEQYVEQPQGLAVA